MRSRLRAALRAGTAPVALRQLRREFNAVARRKKRHHQHVRAVERLEALKHRARHFWRDLLGQDGSSPLPPALNDPEAARAYFAGLFTAQEAHAARQGEWGTLPQETALRRCTSQAPGTAADAVELNLPLVDHEVEAAISSLPLNV